MSIRHRACSHLASERAYLRHVLVLSPRFRHPAAAFRPFVGKSWIIQRPKFQRGRRKNKPARASSGYSNKNSSKADEERKIFDVAFERGAWDPESVTRSGYNRQRAKKSSEGTIVGGRPVALARVKRICIHETRTFQKQVGVRIVQSSGGVAFSS